MNTTKLPGGLTLEIAGDLYRLIDSKGRVVGLSHTEKTEAKTIEVARKFAAELVAYGLP